MSELVRTFTITVGKVYNGEQECRHPKVELVDNEGAAVSCINLRKGIYRVQIGLKPVSSLTFSVKCEDAVCDKCEEKTIVKRFCDSVNGCDEGEYCDSDGFCASIFSEFYTGGTEDGNADGGRNRCNDQHPCPGNKQCKNGRCECPIGTIENGDWCSDCDNADDCGICETCESVGNYSVCRQKDCNCNSVGDCVECTNSGHCDANEVCDNNECKCVGGAVRVNGVCTEIECEDDGECKDCEYCGGITCLPIRCPIGKSLQIVNGICSCVDDDGTDGQEPSSSPSPSPSDPDDPCANLYCVTAFDCDFGCGCDKGICSSCSNYEVEDCVVSGCTVFAGSCVGDPNGPTNPETECTDSTIITKDDSNCTITGTVTKSSCCSCSPLTIDALVSKVRPSGSNKKLDFTVELRKGVFLSDSPFANPLVDNYGHPNIAENEPPISGTVSLSVVTQYDIYSPSGSYLGVSSDPETVYTQPISGTSKAVFNEIFIYTPGFAVSSEKVVKKTMVEVRHSGQFVFENECKYASGSTVGSFVFDSSADFTINVPPVGTTIQSSNCRKPFFKWTKSADTDFNESPFRKTYAPEVDGGFKDVLTYAEGAESCYYYKLESDCNCEEPASLFIVFCNPDIFPKPTLSNCNKTADITIYPTCEANYDKDYELYINNAKVQTLRLNTTFSKEYTAESPITNITLKLKCDIAGECDIEHVYDIEELELDPVVICNADGITVTATWDRDGLTKVDYGISESFLYATVTAVNGVAIISDLESDVVYYYRLTYTSCISAIGSFTKSCPAANKPLIQCNGDGTFTISNLDESGVYNLNPAEVEVAALVQIFPEFGQYIITEEQAKVDNILTYDVAGIAGEIFIPKYSASSCCNIVYSAWVEGLTLFIVIHRAKEFPVVVNVSNVLPQYAQAEQDVLTFDLPGPGAYSIIFVCGETQCTTEIDIEIQDCEVIDIELFASGCNYITNLSNFECRCDPAYAVIGGITTVIEGNTIKAYAGTYTYYITGGNPRVIEVGDLTGEEPTLIAIADLTCIDGVCDPCAQKLIEFRLGLYDEPLDGCDYYGSTPYTFCTDGTYSGLDTVNLTRLNDTTIKLNWFADGELVTTTYTTGPYPTSFISASDGVFPGQEIRVETDCDCTKSASTTDCLSTTITDIELTELNSHVSFTLDTCYLNSIVSVSLYDCGNNLIDTVTTSGSNLNDGYTFELGSSLCMGTSKLTYAFYRSGCVGEVEFDIPPISSISSSPSSSISSSSSTSISSSLSSSISSSPSSSPSASRSSSISSSISLSPSSSISSSISPSTSVSSSPSTSVSPSGSISSSPSLGSSPSTSISDSPSASISQSPSGSISSSISSSPSGSISSSISSSPSESISSSPSSSLSESISTSISSSPSESISDSPSTSISDSISSSPSAGSSISSSPSRSPSRSISSSISSSLSRSSSRSSSISSSRSSSPSRSRSSSRSSSVSPSSSISSSPSSSRSSSRSSSVSPSTSISNSPSSSRSSSRSSSISSSPSVPPDLCDCYTGTITLASFSCYLGSCWLFASTTFTRENSACPSLLSYLESDFIFSGSLYGTAADSISGTADEIGVEFSYNVGGVPNICGNDTFTLYGIDSCPFDTQFVSISPCVDNCSPCLS